MDAGREKEIETIEQQWMPVNSPFPIWVTTMGLIKAFLCRFAQVELFVLLMWSTLTGYQQVRAIPSVCRWFQGGEDGTSTNRCPTAAAKPDGVAATFIPPYLDHRSQYEGYLACKKRLCWRPSLPLHKLKWCFPPTEIKWWSISITQTYVSTIYLFYSMATCFD